MKSKMRKAVVWLLTLMMVSGCVSGCGKKNSSVSTEETEINVRVLRVGFGDEYFNKLKEGFEALYAKEGYKINIVSSDSTTSSSTVIDELLLGESNGIDLYITENVSVDALVQSSKDAGIDMVAADLTDVYESSAIRANGEEESVAIKDKVEDEYLAAFTHDGSQYMFPVHKIPTGLVVNQKLLSEYGLETPKTTDELIRCFETISAKSESTGVYPHVWAGYNAISYWRFLEDVWFAQYSGVENYKKFLSMEYSEDASEGWKVYEDQGLLESLRVTETLLNLNYAPAKTISMDHTTAQHKFMSGEAAFMANGAWLQNEMSSDYDVESFEFEMIGTPVVSALGKKLGLDGKGGTDAKKCDAVLSQVVGLIDESKSTEEIISTVASTNSVTLTAEQVEAVSAARGIYFDKSANESVIVNAYSKKVDVVKLFLRYMASDDGCQIIFENSLTASAINPTEGFDIENQSTFIKSVNVLSTKTNAHMINRESTGLRYKAGVAFFSSTFEKRIASSRGSLHAEDIVTEELEYIQKIWPERVKALTN